jgi:hypothetical protein
VCRRPNSTNVVEEEMAVPHPVLKRKMTEMEDEVVEDEGFDDEVVQTACVIEGSKHADSSIHRQDTHFCHRLYRLDDTRESKH